MVLDRYPDLGGCDVRDSRTRWGMVDRVSRKREGRLGLVVPALCRWWCARAGRGRRGWAETGVQARAGAHAVAGAESAPGARQRRSGGGRGWPRIREPSLKSGVITLGSGFGGTGKTDVAVTLAAIYAAARPADRVILADSNDDMPHGYIRLGGIAGRGAAASPADTVHPGLLPSLHRRQHQGLRRPARRGRVAAGRGRDPGRHRR